MKKELFGLMATLLIMSGICAEKAEEAKTLFDGKNLAGWVVRNDAKFVATNGVLRLVSGMGWLQSEKQYTDFVLELEWRALEPGYDSGIFIRAGTNGTPWPEQSYQVNLARSSIGSLVKGRRTVVPAETAPVPVNTWVKFKIKVHGTRIALEVDGEPAWEYDKLELPSGFIGIQAEQKPMEFRNVKLSTSVNGSQQ